MRLSTKGRYAVMAMADLAKNGRAADGQTRAVSLAEIAARQEISLSYLEQLFARLRKSGLVRSVRGPGGGDRLAMLKYGVPDLRSMFEADTRWLKHYGFSAFAAPNPASGLS